MKIAFLWQGGLIHKGKRWQDGLYAAMQILEDKYDIRYFEPLNEEGILKFNPDIILFWGALSENVKPQVVEYPYKKAICFGGGEVDKSNIEGFDLYFYESTMDGDKMKMLGKKALRAFGVNEKLYRPMNLIKKYDAVFAGTFALWKRHYLFAESVHRGLAVGLKQPHEMQCVEVCLENNIKVLDEQPPEKIVEFINESEVVLNTADLWGGGQRLTLEAMACNVPPIVMRDAPKNAELVEESGFGVVVEPNIDDIRYALVQDYSGNGRKYIESKWTAKHYADALDKGLKQL